MMCSAEASANIFQPKLIYFYTATGTCPVDAVHARENKLGQEACTRFGLEDRFMPRGRKKLTLDEKIRETQQSIYNLENRTQELYEQLQGLLEEKKRQELEKLSDALDEAGVSVEEVLEHIRTQESGMDTANIA